MRVLYVVASTGVPSETFIRGERLRVEGTGVHTTVVAFKDEARRFIRVPGFAILRQALHLSRNPWKAAVAAGIAEGILRKYRTVGNRPDVVHAHFASSPALVSLLLGRKLGVPVTFTAHANDYRVGVTPIELARRVGSAAHVFAISEYGVRDLRKRASLTSREADRVSVVRAQTVAFDATSGATRTRQSGDVFRVVTIARLVRKKGIDDGLRVIARLVQAGVRVCYDIVGAGPEEDSLRNLASTLDISASVRFLGALDHEAALGVLAQADLALLPCRTDGTDVDGIPVFLMEAVGLGIPAIATDISGIPELLPTSIQPGDVDALVCAAKDIALHPEIAKQRATEIRERSAREFAGAVQVERLVRVWKDIASKG